MRLLSITSLLLQSHVSWGQQPQFAANTVSSLHTQPTDRITFGQNRTGIGAVKVIVPGNKRVSQDLTTKLKQALQDDDTDFRRDRSVQPFNAAWEAALETLPAGEFIRLMLPSFSRKRLNLLDLTLKRADLSGASLQNVSFIGANLTGANLSNTNLQGTLFFQTTLKNANVSGAVILGSDILQMNDLTGLNIAGAQGIWRVGQDDEDQYVYAVQTPKRPFATVAASPNQAKNHQLLLKILKVFSKPDVQAACQQAGEKMDLTPFKHLPTVYQNLQAIRKALRTGQEPPAATAFFKTPQEVVNTAEA